MNDLNKLKEKYWSGESTLEEERLLRDHFADNNEAAGPEEALFAFFKAEQEKTYSKVVKMPKTRIRSLINVVLPIAASLTLLLGVYWSFNAQKSNYNETVIEDPQVALEITREAFALLNGKMAKSQETIKESIVHLDKTLIFKNL